MLQEALKSLQMIKFARKANFYFQSFLDPEADAYDAVKNEIFKAQEADANKLDPTTGNRVGAANKALFDAALHENDLVAENRRKQMLPHYQKGAIIGGSIGAGLGGTTGYFGTRMLGFGAKGKALGTLAGTLLGAGLGAYTGAPIAGNYYINGESAPIFDNGTSILTNLNNKLNTAKGTKDVQYVDDTSPANAASNAKKRKENK